MRLWSGADGSLLKTVADHLGPVRCLDLVPALGGFLSTSNDGTTRLRAADDGAALATLNHPPNAAGESTFVLGGCCLHGAEGDVTEIVSAGEDGVAAVWRADGEMVQASSFARSFVRSFVRPSIRSFVGVRSSWRIVRSMASRSFVRR